MAPVLLMMSMIGAAVAIIVLSLSYRYRRHELKHKERMTAIEKGVALPIEPLEQPPAPWSPRVYLLRGLIWLFTGIATGIFLLGVSATINSRQETYEDRLWRAQNLRSSGATAEEIKDFLSHNEPVNNRRFPEGFALIGLIPAGVGLAYLIYYRGEQKRIA
jgi:Domain of unknown function (DUF6249)